MSMFGALDAASSGVALGRTWLDSISDNVANSNTVRPAGQEPYRAKLVVARSLPGTEGVGVQGIQEQGGQPEVVYDPENPLADGDGYVTRPVVDLAFESGWIRGIRPSHLPIEILEGMAELVDRTAVKLVGCDKIAARLHDRVEDQHLRSVSRCHCETGGAALERRHPLLEDRLSGVHDSGIDIPELFQSE